LNRNKKSCLHIYTLPAGSRPFSHRRFSRQKDRRRSIRRGTR